MKLYEREFMNRSLYENLGPEDMRKLNTISQACTNAIGDAPAPIRCDWMEDNCDRIPGVTKEEVLEYVGNLRFILHIIYESRNQAISIHPSSDREYTS